MKRLLYHSPLRTNKTGSLSEDLERGEVLLGFGLRGFRAVRV